VSAGLLLALLALGAFVHRALLGRLGAGVVAHLVRLPGNLLHELAHAVALLATGYTVANLTVSLLDSAGRGGVRPGPPWTRLARPWIANLVAPVAPVASGLAALAVLHPLLGAPGLPTSVDSVLPLLRAVPWASWQLWAGLALAFSITAETAPSDIDLAAWWKPALVAAVLVGGAAYGLEQWRPGELLAQLQAVDAVSRPFVARALALGVWSALAFAPVAWLAGKLRGA
jgi:hypothetical protein